MKQYAVIFETSAQENVRDSYDWVATRGERRRPNDGFATYG